MREQHIASAVRPSLLAPEAIWKMQVREHVDGTSVATPGSALVWPLGLLCMGIAVIVNVGLFETAAASGVSFRIKGQVDLFETFQQLTTGFREIEVTNVLINTVVPFLIGLALFRIALRRSITAAVTVMIIGVAFAIATISLPMSLETTDRARELLARMHLVTGALFTVAVLPALVVGARGRNKGPTRDTPVRSQ